MPEGLRVEVGGAGLCEPASVRLVVEGARWRNLNQVTRRGRSSSRLTRCAARPQAHSRASGCAEPQGLAESPGGTMKFRSLHGSEPESP
eukprot:144727-Rhodomonas_salina.3